MSLLCLLIWLKPANFVFNILVQTWSCGTNIECRISNFFVWTMSSNIYCQFYFDITIIHSDLVLLNKYCFPYPSIKVMSGLTDHGEGGEGMLVPPGCCHVSDVSNLWLWPRFDFITRLPACPCLHRRPPNFASVPQPQRNNNNTGSPEFLGPGTTHLAERSQWALGRLRERNFSSDTHGP